jgi:putative ABC transport system substrate-binding protein
MHRQHGRVEAAFEGAAVRRRDFITLVGGTAVTWPLIASAQQPAGPARLVGVLMGIAASDPAAQSLVAEFRDALTKLGWTEHQNLRIEVRWGSGDANKMKAFAKELVDLRPDAILSQSTAATGAIASETRTIPIVFTIVADPIGSGFAASLARPGGNITGFSNTDPAIGSKWVGLLKEIAPRTDRVALLANPATASALQSLSSSIQAAASSLVVRVSDASVREREEIEGIFASQANNGGGGVIVMPGAFAVVNREPIIELAARYNVPTIYPDLFFAESGGLIAYGADFADEFRLAAGYIDRILKGTKPADLPIELPTKFRLFINLKAAKALGLTIPPTLLTTADKVIQ